MTQTTKTNFKFALINFKENLFHRLTESEINLVKNTHLFDSLDQKEFTKLLKAIRFTYYPADTLIFSEGSRGDELYIVAEGSVRVFTNIARGEKISLARLDKGGYFGEQALIGDANKSRNASIETITETLLMKISRKYFQSVLELDTQLSNTLIALGEKQLIANIISIVNSYSDLKNHIEENPNEIVTYNANTVIFEFNEEPEYVYIILEGTVKTTLPNMPTYSDIILHKGHIFGEVAVLGGGRHPNTATANENVRLIRISKDDFIDLYRQNSRLKEMLDTLGKTYSLPKRGYASQYFGRIDGSISISTHYTLGEGREVIAIHSNDNFVMTQEPLVSGQIIKYSKTGTDIELTIAAERLVGIKCIGHWDDLPNACALVLDNKIVTENIIDDFVKTGTLTSDDMELEYVCECMSINKKTISSLIKDGCNTLGQISEKTGACTVCGSCRHRILSMLGKNVWLVAVMAKKYIHNDDVISYAIKPSLGMFNAFIPGEHIIIQLKIGSNWVERAYSLSDFNNDTELRITVKKEEDGIFTQWLFKHAKDELSIYATQPQGNFKMNLDGGAPIVCFAGGIGITPFIAFAKFIKDSQPKRKMHLIYIAPTQADFIFLDEIEEVKQHADAFELTLWERNVKGYLQTNDIKRFLNGYEKADIYICGPEGFEISLVKLLDELSYRKDKIFIEIFTYAAPKTT